MNLFNICQRLKNKISVISSNKAQRGKGAKAQRFVPVLSASGLLCLCVCLLVFPAWAKTSSTRRKSPGLSSPVSSEKTRHNALESSSPVSSEKTTLNSPESSSPVSSEKTTHNALESSSPVSSEKTTRNSAESSPPVSSDTEQQFLIEKESEYQYPQRSVAKESVDLLKEKLNEKQGSGIRNQGPGKTSGILTPDTLFPSSSLNSGASMLKAALSLALVLALIWVLSYLVKKYYLKGNLLGEKYIRTLDTCSLGSKGSLALVRVEEQTLLLGITSQQITLLAQVNLPGKSMPEKPKMKAAENKQPVYPNPANRQTRSAMHSQASSPAGTFNLSPDSRTGLDGEENQGQGRAPYHGPKTFDDFAEQLSLHSMRFQPPEPPEGSNAFHGSNVQESSTDTIAGILESRFRGLKKI